MTTLIPGHPNIKELGFVNPTFFITVSEQNGIAGHSNHATVGRTNGSKEFITYVSFQVPTINHFPGATADSKAILVPLPKAVEPSGSKKVQIFSLQAGVTLPATSTFNTRPGIDQNLSDVIYGGPTGVKPVTMDIFVNVPANFGGKQEFEVRSTGDNSHITFEIPLGAAPHGMALVIANIS